MPLDEKATTLIRALVVPKWTTAEAVTAAEIINRTCQDVDGKEVFDKKESNIIVFVGHRPEIIRKHLNIDNSKSQEAFGALEMKIPFDLLGLTQALLCLRQDTIKATSDQRSYSKINTKGQKFFVDNDGEVICQTESEDGKQDVWEWASKFTGTYTGRNKQPTAGEILKNIDWSQWEYWPSDMKIETIDKLVADLTRRKAKLILGDFSKQGKASESDKNQGQENDQEDEMPPLEETVFPPVDGKSAIVIRDPEGGGRGGGGDKSTDKRS